MNKIGGIMVDFFRKHAQVIWKWSAIVLICLLCFSTCSNCNHRQNAAWSGKEHQEVVDSLNSELDILRNDVLILRDSLAIMNNELSAHIDHYNARIEADQQEIEYLRGLLKDNNSKAPIIIYKDKQEN